MPVAKLNTGGTPDPKKTADQVNNSLDTFIRQAMGKEPLPRTGEGPVQWMQWLHSMDQPVMQIPFAYASVSYQEFLHFQCSNPRPLKKSRGIHLPTVRIKELFDISIACGPQVGIKYITGWSLSNLKMQKCEKCSREFCSPINHRRHIRLHRRSSNSDKESRKYRNFLGAFWDKVKEVVSLQDISLKETSGSALVQALATALGKPTIWSLPLVYIKEVI